jgi:hypothetical protein
MRTTRRAGSDNAGLISLPPAAGVPALSYAALVNQFHAAPQGKLYGLHGGGMVFRLALSIAARVLLKGMTVALVDGTNRFDVYFIAEFARRVAARGGPPPEVLLQRIFVSRAFTCYQMEAAVTERLPAFIVRSGAPVALLFGPLDSFYDDQAPLFEVNAGVDRMITALERIRDTGTAVLTASQEVRLASRERSRLLPRLVGAMDNMFLVNALTHVYPWRPHDGTNSTDIYHGTPAGGRELGKIPAGTPERRSGRDGRALSGGTTATGRQRLCSPSHSV